jgi:hypothetical protein
VKEFTARLTELERQIDSSIAYDAVENLVNAYGYYLDDSTDNLPKLFLDTTDRSLIQNRKRERNSSIGSTGNHPDTRR